MPELDFQVTGVEPRANGFTPLLLFQLEIANQPPTEPIQSVLLQAQIQIRSPQRHYTAREREKLGELFGPPSEWGRTLRNRLWTIAHATIGAFSGSTRGQLPVPCSYDLNIAATRYCYALEDGEVPLLFLFSGTVFYTNAEGRLQAQQISWNKEALYAMPVRLWKEMMNSHFPNSAWLYLHRDVFDRLCAYKREAGLATWEQTIERLLPAVNERAEVVA